MVEEDFLIKDIKSEYGECNIGLEGVPMYRHMDLETFSPQLTGVEPWNLLASEDFTSLLHTTSDKENTFCNFGTPSKMMGDHSLISDNPMDHASFITMKTQGLEEVALDTSHVNQLLFHDVGVPNDLIIEQGVEVGSENPHGDIMIVRNLRIKQEDIIEGEEVITCSEVDNEVVIDDNMESHLDTDHFVIGSSIDIGSDQIEDAGFDDTKLVIDTEQYCMDEDPSTIGYDCQECGVLFKSKAALKKHLKNCHSKVSKSKSKKNSTKEKFSPTNKRYNCTSCTYTSTRRDKLDRHMEKHVLLDGVHPCGKRRHKPDTLPQRHRHNAEEYKCPHCPYSCTVSKALKKHMKVHASGNSNFTLKLSCKICGKDRPSESEMQRHMKKHKKDANFLCDICNFSSVQLKKIIQHRRMHTGDKPHLCPHCFYRSARRDNLRSHVRRMHKRQNMYIDTFNPKEDVAL
ncbi:zinc finger and SCAN domain-containing protein 12-like isoform X3 [Argiope bruennichi]|nr:zinc finger and SCAN domain-containing protein 12-like isoform X3 [Argiope bruennichi]